MEKYNDIEYLNLGSTLKADYEHPYNLWDVFGTIQKLDFENDSEPVVAGTYKGNLVSNEYGEGSLHYIADSHSGDLLEPIVDVGPYEVHDKIFVFNEFDFPFIEELNEREILDLLSDIVENIRFSMNAYYVLVPEFSFEQKVLKDVFEKYFISKKKGENTYLFDIYSTSKKLKVI